MPAVVEVHLVRPEDVPVAAISLVRAFHDDPMLEYMFPDPRTRQRALSRFFTLQLRQTPRGRGAAYTTEGCHSTAMWVPPRSGPPTARELMAQVPKLLVLGRRAGAALRVVQLVEARHPKTPHYYLGGLGTDPVWQGRGFGSAVLAPVLAICDRDGRARLPRVLQGKKCRLLQSPPLRAHRRSHSSRELCAPLAHVARACPASLQSLTTPDGRLSPPPMRSSGAAGVSHSGLRAGSKMISVTSSSTARAGAEGSPVALRRFHEAPRDLLQFHESELVQQVARHSRRRQDGGPPALEGERGDEAGAVDLGSGEKGRASRRYGGVYVGAKGRPAKGSNKGTPFSSRRVISPAPARGWSNGTTRTRSSSNRGVTARSAPSAGRSSTAMSTCPVAIWVSRRVVGGLDEDKAQVGVSLRDGTQKLGDEPARSRADYPDTNRPGHLAGEGHNVGEHRIELGLDSPRPGYDDLARLGELPGRAVDQLAAELTLEFFHVRRDVRLHRLQSVGGSRE